MCFQILFENTRTELEIWPQRPMYFAATIAIHHSGGGGTFHGGVVLSMGVALFIGGGTFPWGGGLTLVLTWLMTGGGGVASMGGGQVKHRSRQAGITVCSNIFGTKTPLSEQTAEKENVNTMMNAEVAKAVQNSLI